MFACTLLLTLDRLVHACSCIDSNVHSCFQLWSALSQSSWIRRYIIIIIIIIKTGSTLRLETDDDSSTEKKTWRPLTVFSFFMSSSGAPRLANPSSWENCANAGSANSGTWPSSSWHTSLQNTVNKNSYASHRRSYNYHAPLEMQSITVRHTTIQDTCQWNITVGLNKNLFKTKKQWTVMGSSTSLLLIGSDILLLAVFTVTSFEQYIIQ